MEGNDDAVPTPYTTPQSTPRLLPAKRVEDLRESYLSGLEGYPQFGFNLEVQTVSFEAAKDELHQKQQENRCRDYNNMFAFTSDSEKARILAVVLPNLKPIEECLLQPKLSLNPFAPDVKPPLTVMHGKNVFVGKTSVIGPQCVINDSPVHSVRIGECVSIGAGVKISCQRSAQNNEGIWDDSRPMVALGEVLIEEEVVVEDGVTLVAPVHIGAGSIIKAGAVIEGKRVPKRRVFSGNPAEDKGAV